MLEWLNKLPPATLTLVAAALGMAGALLGSIIGAGATLLVTLINKRADERKHTRELAVKWGTEAWRAHFDGMMKKGGTIGPVEDYIFLATAMARHLVDKKQLSDDDIRAFVKKSHELGTMVIQERRRISGYD